MQPTSQRVLALSFLLIAFLTVCALQLTQRIIGFDPFVTPILNGPYVSIDSWSFIHTMTFICCGLGAPRQKLFFMATGILWEAAEYALTSEDEFWSERGINSLWDIWFNLLGYRIGEILSARQKKWGATSWLAPPAPGAGLRWSDALPPVFFAAKMLALVSLICIVFLKK
eukprot:gb/GEZN01021297.1/.p1 GENE.gb/GEZN01021297.1/~~gb/GEZN01021297.1/.p1  ORF type:complete len:170 (-),score=19.67 gb/GEZN01021297.1/:84-593(-)